MESQQEIKQEEVMEGFVLEDQVELAKFENKEIPVHIRGADLKPAWWTDDTGTKRPVLIWVTGEHSDYMRQAESRIRRRKLKPNEMTGELFYNDNIEKAAACTRRWEGLFSRTRQGGPRVEVACIPHNVKELYKKCPWVLEDVEEGIRDHARFFESNSPNS